MMALDYSFKSEQPQISDVTAINSMTVAGIEINMKTFGKISGGALMNDIASNREKGKIQIKASDGWNISSLKYYTEDSTDLMILKDGWYTTNNFSENEKAAKDIDQDTELAFGKTYTNFYVKATNDKTDKTSKFILSISAYDNLVIDCSDMILDKTTFVFNMNVSFGRGGYIRGA